MAGEEFTQASDGRISYCLSCMSVLSSDASTQCPCSNIAVENPAHCIPADTVLKERYLVGRVLGQGGFGITYIGRDLVLDTRVAIKEYYPKAYTVRANDHSFMLLESEHTSDGRLKRGVRQFLDEARILAKYQNEAGIVRVRDFFEANNTAYIVMDYLDGDTLKNALKQQTVAPATIFSLVQPLLDALEKMHGDHMIHRDISPDNIMRLHNGTLCLLDFGAAHAMDDADGRSVSMVLKPGFAPEEQYRTKGKLGPWTDIYALCASMYWAICGVSPDESLQRLIDDEMKWPTDLGISITQEQEAVLKRGMEPHHANRYQSIKELRADIQQALASTEGTETTLTEDIPNNKTSISTPVTTGTPSEKSFKQKQEDTHKKRPHSNYIKGAIAAAICLLLSVGGIFWLTSPITISFDTGGSPEMAPLTTNRMNTLEAPTNPVREGYDFTGWYSDKALTQNVHFPLHANTDMLLYADWEAAQVAYTLTYEDAKTGASLAPAKELSGAYGSIVSEEPLAIDGYVLTSDKDASLTLSADPKDNVITFLYKQLTRYVVEYKDEATQEALIDAKTSEQYAEDTQIEETAPDIPGYTLVSDNTQSITLKRKEANNTIVFYYAAEVDETANQNAYNQSAWQYNNGYSGNSGTSSGASGNGASRNQSSKRNTSNDVEWAN